MKSGKELNIAGRTAMNGILIYGILVWFHSEGKIKHQNMKITFAALGLWFLIVTWRYFRMHFIDRKSNLSMEKAVLILSILNVILFLAGALGFYYGS